MHIPGKGYMGSNLVPALVVKPPGSRFFHVCDLRVLIIQTRAIKFGSMVHQGLVGSEF